MKLSFGRTVRFGAVLVAVVALSSCSVRIGGSADGIPQEDLERKVETGAAKGTDQEGSATCEGDLEAEEDATQECTWEGADGDEVRVVVTATKIVDGGVEYIIEEEERSRGQVDQKTLEQKVREGMDQETGQSFPVTCDGGLKGEKDATQRCAWTAPDGGTLGIDVTVTGFDDEGDVNFDFQADDQPTPPPPSDA